MILEKARPNAFAAFARAGYFLTKIYHPNVSSAGEICVNTLKRDWKSDLGLCHVLKVAPRFIRTGWQRPACPPPPPCVRAPFEPHPPCPPASASQVIWCLLVVPFPESSLNDEAGKLFMDSYEEFTRKAKLMTRWAEGLRKLRVLSCQRWPLRSVLVVCRAINVPCLACLPRQHSRNEKEPR